MLDTESSLVQELREESALLKETVKSLQEQLEWFKRQMFGKKSEKVTDVEQQLTLAGFERTKPAEESESRDIPAHTRKIKRKGEDTLSIPDDLPEEEILLDLPDKEKEGLKKIGEEISKKLAHTPGRYYIKKYVRPKYADPKKEESGIVIAPMVDSILPRCKADESFLAEMLTMKFADHLPLYRISEIAGRSDLGISHKLLSQWAVSLGQKLKPLHAALNKEILTTTSLFIDETPIAIQKSKKGYMWVISDGTSHSYHFKTNRDYKHAKEILGEYSEVLHSDKFGAYQNLAEEKAITWSPCWAHIRRKFYDAQSDPLFRDYMLKKIGKLFEYEREAWNLGPEERLHLREEKEVPIINELIEKVQEKRYGGGVLPKSKLWTALGYFIGLQPYLKNYTKHADARMDNNVAERAIRPLTIGRKNWLFVGSERAGESAAVLLSLVQTCRNLKVNPRKYLEDVMRRLMSHSANKLHELLPHHWQSPQL